MSIKEAEIRPSQTLPSTLAHNSPTATPHYDHFLFVDSLTNRSIALRHIRDRSRFVISHRHSKTQDLGSEAQIKQLDECIELLKETMAFRRNALRQKLFGDMRKQGEGVAQGEEVFRKKRLIRQVVAQQIDLKNRTQLQKYLYSPGHTFDQNLVKATRSTNFPLSKKAISKLVNSLQKKQPHPMQMVTRKEEVQDPFTGKMEEIELEMKNEIRQKLRKSGQFLIDPQYHFIQTRSFAAGRFQQHFQATAEQRRSFLQQLHWKPTAPRETLRNKKKPTHNVVNNKQNASIVALVANGQVEDVEIFVEKHRKQCLRAHDQRGNSLLHIAAIHNKVLTFQWLLRKLGVCALLEKNEQGMTAGEVAAKLDRREILSYIPHSML